MKNIGLQLYSIREISEKDFFGAIKLTADSGYDGIEFAGYFDTPAKELKKVLDGNGIVACGTHTGFEELENEFNKTVEYNLEIDNRYIIIPWIPTEMCDSRDSWLKTAEKMNFMNDKIRSQGIKFGYHNHAFEFEKFDGNYGYDILAENTAPDILLEIDTFWVEYAGGNVVEYVKKYKDRLDLIHIKDMNDDRISTEIGSGNMDFFSIVEAADETDWFIVEQEAFSIPMEKSIKISFDYLKGILK
ncbi:MAG: sugar phosphate isomerase/epimerase [Clostridiales bacterium]|nr:sugar phosphate isomerase/epimerase [Clostridiales bacterium]